MVSICVYMSMKCEKRPHSYTTMLSLKKKKIAYIIVTYPHTKNLVTKKKYFSKN